MAQHQLSAAAWTQAVPQGKVPVGDLVVDLFQVRLSRLGRVQIGAENRPGIIAHIVPCQQHLPLTANGAPDFPEMHQLFHAVLLLLHRQHRIICKRRNGEKAVLVQTQQLHQRPDVGIVLPERAAEIIPLSVPLLRPELLAFRPGDGAVIVFGLDDEYAIDRHHHVVDLGEPPALQ